MTLKKYGWTVELDSDGDLVTAPNGRHSASLACALDTGIVEDNEDELQIPQHVYNWLEEVEDGIY